MRGFSRRVNIGYVRRVSMNEYLRILNILPQLVLK